MEYWDGEAEAFNSQYETLPRFVEREIVWKRALDRVDEDVAANLIAADVGCGPGRLSEMLVGLGRRTVCIDQSEEMLRLARARVGSAKAAEQVEFRHAALPFKMEDLSGSAGIVVCSSVLEYVDDPLASVKSLASLLHPDGVMLVSLPSMRSRYRRYESLLRWIPILRPSYLKLQIWRPSIEEATKAFGQVGLKVTGIEYYGAPSRPAIFGKPGTGAETLVLFTLEPSAL